MEKCRKLKKLIAIILCVCVLFAIGFTIIEADHDCVGDGCSICCQISMLNDFLKSFGVCIILICLFAIFAKIYSAVYSEYTEFEEAVTLFGLKTELLD